MGKEVEILIQVMVAVESSNPTGGNYFLLFKTPRCQFCTEMSDLC